MNRSYIITLTALILLSTSVMFGASAQILDFSNSSTQKNIQATAYDGSFLASNPSMAKEVKAGLTGQVITILKLSPSSILRIDGTLVNAETDPEQAASDRTSAQTSERTSARASAVRQIVGSEWTIQTFVDNDHANTFTVTDGNKTYTLKFQESDEWFIKEGLEKLQQQMTGMSFISFRKGLKVTGLDGNEFVLDGETPVTVTDVQFAKISSTDYSVVLIFDNGLIKQYHPKQYHPDADKKEGWIETGEIGSYTFLVDEKTLEKYASENSDFIEAMRAGNARLGMTEEQALLAWGKPTEIYRNYAGYDKVIMYANSGNTKLLYIEDGIVKLLR